MNYFTETIKKSGQNQMSRDINNAPNTNNINQIDTRPQTTSQFTNGKSNVMVTTINYLMNEIISLKQCQHQLILKII